MLSPLRSGAKPECLLSLLLFHLVLEGQAVAVRQEKEIRGRSKRMEQVKPSLFTCDMILCIEKSKESTHKKLLEVINEFSIVMGYNINIER